MNRGLVVREETETEGQVGRSMELWGDERMVGERERGRGTERW